ncbi:MAG: hypothetical protein EXS08_16275 [Planctomycetes bacterium]|nr:hypothetical protein [Planctomycetota bacterium]
MREVDTWRLPAPIQADHIELPDGFEVAPEVGAPIGLGGQHRTRREWHKLLEKIGQGGFGTVWMAEQEAPLRRRVALKILKWGMDTRQVVARFVRDACGADEALRRQVEKRAARHHVDVFVLTSFVTLDEELVFRDGAWLVEPLSLAGPAEEGA